MENIGTIDFMVGLDIAGQLHDQIRDLPPGRRPRSPRRQGIGRELVRFAERWSREQGLDTMQLEVLVPRQWSHPSKEFLRAWYTRIGYRPVRTGQFEESYPELAPLLATPCDFVIYHKSMRTLSAGEGWDITT